MFDNEYGPDIVLIKDNTYVRPGNVDYMSFVKDEEGDLGTATVMFNSQNGIAIPGVTQKDFKIVADAANWYSLEKERKAVLPSED